MVITVCFLRLSKIVVLCSGDLFYLVDLVHSELLLFILIVCLQVKKEIQLSGIYDLTVVLTHSSRSADSGTLCWLGQAMKWFGS